MIRRLRLGWLVLYFLLAIAFTFVACRGRHTVIAGDGVEYLGMLEALFHHQSPDLRPEDVKAVHAVIDTDLSNSGFLLDLTGHRITYHFWMYPLAVLPMKYALRAIHANELYAFEVTNRLLFAAAVAIALRWFPGTRFRRWSFTLLSAVGPVTWYLGWAHPETYSWALVMIALVCFANRRVALAALVASLAATQNVPIVFLALGFALQPLLARRFGRAALTAFACAPAFLPSVFYYLAFHYPSPFIECGEAKARYMSFWRVLGILFDLNEGMLPYVPGLLVLGLVGLVVAIRRRAWVPLFGVAILFAMMLGATQSVNWNHGCCGILRYAIWLIPLFAWLASDLPRGMVFRVGVVVTLIGHWIIVRERPALALERGEDDSLSHTALASWVLAHHPKLYSPDPEIFVERTLQRPTAGAKAPFPLPVVFEDGGLGTKILASNATLAKLRLVYDVDPAFFEEVAKKHASDDRDRMYYAYPPRGAVRRRTDVLPTEVTGSDVVLGAEWSAPERDPRGFAWHRMRDHATLRIVRGDIDMWLGVVGKTTAALAPRFEWVRGDATVLSTWTPTNDEVNAPIRIPKATTPGEVEAITLRATPMKPGLDGPTFSLFFTYWAPAREPLDTGNPDVTLVAGWRPPLNELRCADKHAELSLRRSAKKMKLHFRGGPPGATYNLLKKAPFLTVLADGKEIDHFPFICYQERDYVFGPSDGDRIDVVLDTTIEDVGDAALCLDEMTWAPP